jgi:hypothetical protein
MELKKIKFLYKIQRKSFLAYFIEFLCNLICLIDCLLFGKWMFKNALVSTKFSYKSFNQHLNFKSI